jgi:hypothetical protein
VGWTPADPEELVLAGVALEPPQQRRPDVPAGSGYDDAHRLDVPHPEPGKRPLMGVVLEALRRVNELDL